MLIYNKNLSVCPLTTHFPKKSFKKIDKDTIRKKIKLIDIFTKKSKAKTKNGNYWIESAL